MTNPEGAKQTASERRESPKTATGPLHFQVRAALGVFDQPLTLHHVEDLKNTTGVHENTYKAVTTASAKESADYWHDQVQKDSSLASFDKQYEKWREDTVNAFNNPDNEQVVRDLIKWHDHLGVDLEHAIPAANRKVTPEIIDAFYNRYFGTPEANDPSTRIQKFLKDMIVTYHGKFNELTDGKETIRFVAGIFGKDSADMIIDLLETERKLQTEKDDFVQTAEKIITQEPDALSSRYLTILGQETTSPPISRPTRRTVAPAPILKGYTDQQSESHEDIIQNPSVTLSSANEDGELERQEIHIPITDLIPEGERNNALIQQYIEKLGFEGLKVPETSEELMQYIQNVWEKSGLETSHVRENSEPLFNVLFAWPEEKRQEFINNIQRIQMPDDCSVIGTELSEGYAQVHTHSGLPNSNNKLGVVGLALVHKPSFELLRAMIYPLQYGELEYDPENVGKNPPQGAWRKISDELVYKVIDAVTGKDPAAYQNFLKELPTVRADNQ